MIERGIKLDVKNEQSNVYLIIKLFLMINRIYYPQMVVIAIISCFFLAFLKINIYYYIYIWGIMQMIYFSTAWHECIHISFARFLSYEPIFVSFIPYAFGARTHFDRSKRIENVDKTGILLSAPIILTSIGVVALLVTLKWLHSTIIIIFICAFLLVNVLSFLPNSKCDGGRAYEIFKKMGFKAFSLCMMSILVYVLYSLGLKFIMPINRKEIEKQEEEDNNEK